MKTASPFLGQKQPCPKASFTIKSENAFIIAVRTRLDQTCTLVLDAQVFAYQIRKSRNRACRSKSVQF